MESFQILLQTNFVTIILFILFIVLFILYLVNNKKLNKINKNYQEFMMKLGNGKNIEEDLVKYIQKVEEVDTDNKEIIEYYHKMNANIEECLQKVGIVRYTAYEDVGSDLSFALALLDKKNNGIVLNGIYSRETSNIYAKPVINGKSKYTLSNEEQQAIQKAKEEQI